VNATELLAMFMLRNLFMLVEVNTAGAAFIIQEKGERIKYSGGHFALVRYLKPRNVLSVCITNACCYEKWARTKSVIIFVT
jgi:hypothetical protein